ncbi:MAG: DUF3429 domain-containing protein [Pseudomonadota bacterium]
MTVREVVHVPPAARWLGAAGLLPFVGLTMALWIGGGDTRELSTTMMEGYGVAILAFMGGCRWGFAAAGLGQGPTFWPLAISVLPALFAWAMLLFPPHLSLSGLAVGFIGLLLADVLLTRHGGAPFWWSRLRLPLSLGAATCLSIGAIRLI